MIGQFFFLSPVK